MDENALIYRLSITEVESGDGSRKNVRIRPDPNPPLVVKLAPQGAESYGGAESLGWSRNRTKPNLLSAAGAPKEPKFLARAGAAKASGKIQKFWLGAGRTRNFWLKPNRIEIWHRLQV
jgi:hypothetical protein